MTATANSIITPQVPKSNIVAVTTANSTYTTAPTNTVLLVTAGVNGSRLVKLQAIPCVSIATANQLQMFRDNATAGVSKFFADSALMTTYTLNQTTEAPTTDFGYSDQNPLILQPNERIYVGEGQSVAVDFLAEWADY